MTTLTIWRWDGLTDKTENWAGIKIMLKIENGKKVKICTDNHYFKLKFGKGVKESIIYISGESAEIDIPSDEALSVFPDGAFDDAKASVIGDNASESEILSYRNLALNPADMPGQNEYFPHTYANFVTRNSIRFESRNAIDGFAETDGHYGFPFQAWGGGDRNDLEFDIDFGRNVMIDKLVIYMRADYTVNEEGLEHDTYWNKITVCFSDNSEMILTLKKSGGGQSFSFEPKTVRTIKLKNLVRDMSFPTRGFAALSQIEVWGRDIIKTE